MTPEQQQAIARAEAEAAAEGKGVVQDIKDVAPGALRTGLELVPSLTTQTEWIPMIIRKIIEKSPFMNDAEKQQTLSEFDASYAPFKEGAEHGPFGMEENPTKIETIRKHVTDPILGPSEDVQAETLPGKMVKRGLEIGPTMFAGPGSLTSKAVSTVGAGVGGPGAAALAQEANLSPAWQTAADVGGSLLGGTAPGAWNHIVNPRPIPPTRQPAVDIMDTHNIPLSVGQRTGDERILRRELMAGGPGAWDEQPAAFTQAATETQGGFPPNTDRLPNAVMRDELNRMGAEFNRMETRANPVPFDNALQNDLLQTTITYQRDNPLVAPVVEDIMNDLAANAAQNNNTLTGAGFQSARSKIGKMIRSDSTDPGVQQALMEMQDALDDVLSRALSPQDQHAFRTVRAQWRNMLPIEYAKSGQGQAKREGFVDPQSLMTGIRNVEGRREVAAGQRPMTELAEAGGTTMIKPSSSGTAENMRQLLSGIATVAGGGLAGSVGLMGQLPPGIASALATGGAVAGFAIPKLRDMFIRSQTGQNIMGRNLAPRLDNARNDLSALLAAALAAEASTRETQPRGGGGPQ